MRLLPLLLGSAILLASSAARADDTMTSQSDHGSDKPQRRRADPALFAAGLTTAIAGGVTLNVGTSLLVVGSDPCMFNGPCTRNADDELQTAGGVLLLAGIAMIASGIPMAIVGGKKVPASAPAAQTGLVPVLTF